MTYPFPLGRPTGGARMTCEIARHLGRAGAVVTVLPVAGAPATVWPRPPLPDAEVRGTAADDLDVRPVRPHPLHWALDGRRMRRAVLRIAAAEPVDAVLSYYHEAAWLGPALRRRGIRHGFIATWQSYRQALTEPLSWVWHRARRPVDRRLVLAPYRRAELVLATSRFTRDELIQVVGVAPERIGICPLGVDDRFFAVDRREPAAECGLLFFGRLVEHKGIFDLLEALARVVARGPSDWRLCVCGQGDAAAVRREAARLGLGDRVSVEGPLGDRALCERLAAARLAVLPSRYEAFGLAFAEAQAAGLPVVGYAAGSVPEVVEDGVTGWLAPAGDVAALARRIEAALRDPARLAVAGRAARQRARQRFRWSHTADIILRELRGVRGP